MKGLKPGNYQFIVAPLDIGPTIAQVWAADGAGKVISINRCRDTKVTKYYFIPGLSPEGRPVRICLTEAQYHDACAQHAIATASLWTVIRFWCTNFLYRRPHSVP